MKEEIRALIEYIPKLMADVAHKLPIQFQSLVMSEMDIGEPSDAWKNAKPYSGTGVFETGWSNSVKLRSQTGGYIKSYLPKHPKTLTRTEVGRYGLKAQIGTEYFGKKNIHETGGFIKSKGKMHKYFWAKYIDSKDEFYKIMALSVMKNGGVTIKKRPSFAPAVKRFKSEVANVWLDEIAFELVKHL